MSDTYRVTVTCDNCGHSGTVDAIRGTTVKECPCPNCQCLTLNRQGDNKVNPTPEVPPFEYLTQPQPVPYVRHPGPYDVYPPYSVWCHPTPDYRTLEYSIYAPGTE